MGTHQGILGNASAGGDWAEDVPHVLCVAEARSEARSQGAYAPQGHLLGAPDTQARDGGGAADRDADGAVTRQDRARPATPAVRREMGTSARRESTADCRCAECPHTATAH